MSIGTVRIDVDECARRALHGCALYCTRSGRVYARRAGARCSVPAARVVAAAALGRDLVAGECVVHVAGNRHDLTSSALRVVASPSVAARMSWPRVER